MRQKGFTLVELLVAIGIIGILSSIAVVSVTSVRAKARDAKRLADVKQIQTALESYMNDKGEYPQTAANAMKLGKTSVATESANWNLNLCSDATGFKNAACGAGETLLGPVPGNPTPHAGTGDIAANDEYLYRSKDEAAKDCEDTKDVVCATYSIIFRLESGSGIYTKGMYEATENGIAQKDAKLSAAAPNWP